MPGPSRSPAPLGSEASIQDDLRQVRYHGGFLSCQDVDLAGTVALLRDRGRDRGDIVASAKQLHQSVAAGIFSKLSTSGAVPDRLQVAIKVIEPAMYGMTPGDSIAGLRRSVAEASFIQPTTLIGYENKLLNVLARLVHRQIVERANPEVAVAPRGESEPHQRRVLRRAQSRLRKLSESLEEVLYPVTQDRILTALWDYLAFVDCVVAEVDAGAEEPILVLGLEDDCPRVGDMGPESDRHWSWTDDRQFYRLLGELLATPGAGWPYFEESERCCRITRQIDRTDTKGLSRSLLDRVGGGRLMARWSSLPSMHGDLCDEPIGMEVSVATCPFHLLLSLVRSMEDRLSIALDYGSVEEAERQRTLDQEVQALVDRVLEEAYLDRIREGEMRSGPLEIWKTIKIYPE